MENPWIRTQQPLVIAHRGNAVAAPENTLAAYHQAYEDGAEMIETDVNISKDGHLVIIHDSTLNRTTNLTGNVHDFTLAELRSAEAGNQFGTNFKGERIPTIDEAFSFSDQYQMPMCFEVKGLGTERSIVIAKKLVEYIGKYNAFDKIFLSSYYHDALAEAKKMAPQLMLAPERLPDDVEPDIPEALRQATSLGAEVLQIHYRYLYPDVLHSLHEAGIAVWAWPTTLEEEIIPAIEAGADAVMGDNPALAKFLVTQHYNELIDD